LCWRTAAVAAVAAAAAAGTPAAVRTGTRAMSIRIRRRRQPIAVDVVDALLVRIAHRGLNVVAILACLVRGRRVGPLFVVSRMPSIFGTVLRARHPRPLEQSLEVCVLELLHLTTLELRRHRDDSVARTNEAADRETERLEQPANLPIAPFRQHDGVPVIGALLVAAAVRDRLDACDAVFELHALDERALVLGREPPEDPH